MPDSLQFASIFDAMLGPKTYPKSGKNRLKMMSKIQCVMWSLCESILGGLGRSLGHQNLSYVGCLGGLILSYLTLSYLIFSYLIFSWISWISCLSWVILGHDRGFNYPGLGPTGLLREYPQEPPKGLPRASKTPPRGPWGQIFGRFLIDCLVDVSIDLIHPQARWRR